MHIPKYLYRFRSAEALFAKEDFLEQEDVNCPARSKACRYTEKRYRDELRRQEIFLAHTDNLNDPMEGNQNMFWYGDQILWKNFFKHYLLCLERNLNYLLFLDDKDSHDYLFIHSKDDLETDIYRDLYESVCDKFISTDNVQKIINYFACSDRKIYKSELYYYLIFIHLYASQHIIESYMINGFIAKQEKDTSHFELLNKYVLKFPKHHFYEKTLHIISNMHKSWLLALGINNNDYSFRKNILINYPEIYLEQIKQLTHFSGHVASFSEHYSNSSMWAHYANAHQGVCLKFKAGTKEKLNLLLKPSAKISSKENIAHSCEFYKVNYKLPAPEIDFFDSLGRISQENILSHWWRDKNGEMSSRISGLHQDYNKWHKDYWNNWKELHSTKSMDWHYESEYRIITTTFSDESKGKKGTNMIYEFNDLEGIIFGKNMLEEHKHKIANIIKAKLNENKRPNFSLYQAYYCNNSNKIEAFKIPTFYL